MQVYNELADFLGKGQAAFSCSTLLSRREEALHSVLFKLIRFASQGALGDIDFFGSLPCGFVEKDEGADRFIKLLFRPERPLFYLGPLVGTLTAGTVE